MYGCGRDPPQVLSIAIIAIKTFDYDARLILVFVIGTATRPFAVAGEVAPVGDSFHHTAPTNALKNTFGWRQAAYHDALCIVAQHAVRRMRCDTTSRARRPWTRTPSRDAPKPAFACCRLQVPGSYNLQPLRAFTRRSASSSWAGRSTFCRWRRHWPGARPPR
eukprot:scaffold14854_cov129-Isochrysis_galbana.AAC.6